MNSRPGHLPAGLGGMHILVVEDDPAQALDLAHALTSAGASVLGPASRLDDATQAITGSRCDGAIVDLRLGDRNATSFAQTLIERNIPFVIWTGYPHSAHFKWDRPGCAFVQKPDDPDRVVAILSDLIWNGGKAA